MDTRTITREIENIDVNSIAEIMQVADQLAKLCKSVLDRNKMFKGKVKFKKGLMQKRWITMQEAMDYLDMSRSVFLKATLGKLTISQIGGKKYYKMEEINQFIEDNTFVKRVG